MKKFKKYKGKMLKAIELSIEVWEALAKSGGNSKRDVPTEVYVKFDKLRNQCPLCNVVMPRRWCDICPLGSCGYNSDYSIWAESNTAEESVHRSRYAKKIVDTLKKSLEDTVKYPWRSIWK